MYAEPKPGEAVMNMAMNKWNQQHQWLRKSYLNETVFLYVHVQFLLV